MQNLHKYKLFILFILLPLFVACSKIGNVIHPNDNTSVSFDSSDGGIADGATDVSLQPIFVLQFNQAMNASTVVSPNIFITTNPSATNADSSSTNIAISDVTANNDLKKFTFTTATELEPSTKYYLVVTNSVKTATGISISGVFSFTTGGINSPQLAIIKPSNNATHVNVATDIEVQFSESVVNVETGLSLRKNDVSGATVPTQLDNLGNNVYRLTPSSPLDPVTRYYVVAESSIASLSGTNLAFTSFNFTTFENRVSMVVSAATYACALKLGNGYCWGKNDSGELGNGSTTTTNVPTMIAMGESSAIPANDQLVSIAAGSAYNGNGATCVIDKNGNAYCFGDGEAGNFGNGQYNIASSYPIEVTKGGSSAIPTNDKLIKIGTNNNSSCALDESGVAYCWGDNTQGQLGDGSRNNSAYAVAIAVGGSSAIPLNDKLVDISVGSLYSCAVDVHGRAYCWGWNSEGQCGDGTFVDSDYPVQVVTSSDNQNSQLSANAVVKQISASANTPCPTNQVSTCAIDESGAGYCWGNNDLGQLGVGTITGSNVPLTVLKGGSSAIPNNAKFSMIAAGSGVTCAVADGKGYCWGANSNGELGNGSNSAESTPVSLSFSGAISESTVLIGISAADYGEYYTIDNGLGCAVDNDNSFYCWGNNNYGQLGNGNNDNSSVPVQVAMPNN